MINRKTKDIGMVYNYGDRTYYIKHDLFRVNDFVIQEPNEMNNQFIKMTIQNKSIETEVSPFYDANIEMYKGMILNIAYIQMDDGSIRVHGYEESSDKSLNDVLDRPKKFIGAESTINLGYIIRKVQTYISMIEDDDIRKFVLYAYNKYNDELMVWPAAVSVHHNYRNGLIQHLCNVARVAIEITDLYTDIDKDIVIAGALLHDIGKLKEYTEDCKISDIGKYQDHIALGHTIITEMFKESGLDIDDRDKSRLLHIILSHHGKLEYGSTKLPASKEAFIVHQADYIDSNMYIYHESYKKVTCGLTDYNKYAGTFIVNENINVSENYDKRED